MRVIAFLVVAFVALAAAAKSAKACPCCNPCSKYNREKMVKMVMIRPVEVYVRERPAAMPRPAKRAKVMALLTRSKWHTRKPGTTGMTRLRVVDGANVPDTMETLEDVENAIVHELRLENGHFVVDLSGGRYQVSPCRDRGQATTCLVLQH